MTDGEESMDNRSVLNVQSCFFANLLKNHRIQFVHVDIGPVQEKQNALYITSRADYSGKTANFLAKNAAISVQAISVSLSLEETRSTLYLKKGQLYKKKT